MPRELYPPTWRCFQLWQTRYTHHRIFSRHCFRNKHFSPQHPILPFLLASISSSTSSLLKDLADPLYIYIYIFPRYLLSRCSPFRLSLCDIHRYPFEWAVHPLKRFFATTFARDLYYSRCERSIYRSDNARQRRWDEMLSWYWRGCRNFGAIHHCVFLLIWKFLLCIRRREARNSRNILYP